MPDEFQDIKEKDPNHKRKMQWFGAGLVVLLCITLALSAFKKPERRIDEGTRKELPIDTQRASVSEDSLQEQIRQRRLKLQREQENEGDTESNMTKEERVQAIRKRQEEEKKAQAEAAAARNGGGGGNGTSSADIYQEFRLQEKRRALMARRSRFGMKPANMGQAGLQPASMIGADTGNPQENVRNQLAVAQQMLDNIQSGKDPHQGLKLSGLLGGQGGPTASAQQAVQKSDDGPRLAGKPVSQGEPLPGQRLIPTATVINAVLDKKVISDYSGPIRGLITRDVYDVSGNYVMIPKGSQFTGRDIRTSNVNEAIQARMGLLIKWIVLPNGQRISFEKRGAAMDQEGVSAIEDEVNYHFIAQFLGVAAYAVLSSETSYTGSGTSNDQTFEGNLSQSMREQFAPLAAKYLNIVPTITLDIGTPINIFLEDDVYAYPWGDSLAERVVHANRTAY